MTLTTARHFVILLGAFFLVPTGLPAESVAESSTQAVEAAEKEGAVNFYPPPRA